MDTVTPRDQHATNAEQLEPNAVMAVPSWARGVLQSKKSAGRHIHTPDAEVRVQHDPESGLQFISVEGFHVVAIEQPSNASVHAAVDLLKRLRNSLPLDVGALTFGGKVRLSARSINQLAQLCVMVSRAAGENALEQAKAAVAEYLTLKAQASSHLLNFVESSH